MGLLTTILFGKPKKKSVPKKQATPRPKKQPKPLSEDEVRISKDVLLNKYRSVTHSDTFMDLLLSDSKMVVMKKSDLEKLEMDLKEQKKHKKTMLMTAEINNKGIALEKDGKIDGAIQAYEENIKIGYPARHSYDRLLILYRKNKDTVNEKRIIELAIEKFPKEDKYKERLSKISPKK